jgi:hypothetical protein
MVRKEVDQAEFPLGDAGGRMPLEASFEHPRIITDRQRCRLNHATCRVMILVGKTT